MRSRPHAVILAVLLAAGVLVVDPSGYSPFGPAKWTAVLVVLALGAAGAFRRPVRVARRPAVVWSVFLILVLVAAIRATDGLYTWIGTPQRHFGALTWGLCALAFVLGHTLDDEGDARLVIGAATVTAGLAGAWAAAEELGWRPIALADSDRLVGSSGNADYLGATMALLLPVAVGVALDRSWSTRWRAVAGVAAALATVALVGSGARGAWVGLIAALVVLGRARWSTVVSRPGRTVALASAAGVAVAALALATGVAGRVPAAVDGHGPGGSSRVAEWEVAVRVIAAHPLTGVGPEGYRLAVGAAVDRSYQRTYGGSTVPDRAHDSLLDVAATTGIPGAVAYLVLIASVGVGLLRALRRRAPPWLAGVVLGLVAYTVGQLLLFPIAELEPGVWLLAGLVTVHSAQSRDLIRLRVPRPVGIVAVVLAALAVVLGGRDIAADRSTRASLVALSAGHPALARRDAARATALAPDDIDTRLAAARVDAASGTAGGVAGALDQLDAALRVTPRDPVVDDRQAELLVQQAQITGRAVEWRAARHVLTVLRVDAPLDPQLLLDSGVVDAATGDDAGARSAWTSAATLAPDSSAPLTDVAVLDLGLGDLSAARTAADAALLRDPGDVRAETVLARTRAVAAGT